MTALTRRTALLGAGLGAGSLAAGTARAEAAPPSARSGSLTRAVAAGLAAGAGPDLVVGAFQDRARVVAGSRPGVDGHSVLQLGSLTKTFTAGVLARELRRGTVGLDDQVASLLPRGLRLPAASRGLTLRELAGQHSGLPPLPAGFEQVPGYDPADPYATYTRADLERGLPRTRPLAAPGASYTYSNLGITLLGEALATAGGAPYAVLLGALTRRLGLRDTRLDLTASMRARALTGHAADGTPVPDWRLGIFAPAGGLWGTADDVLDQLRTMDGASSLARLQRRPLYDLPVEETGGVPLSVCLVWNRQVLVSSGEPFWWHDGQTGGFSAFAAFAPGRRVGVVALAAASTPEVVQSAALTTLERLAG